MERVPKYRKPKGVYLPDRQWPDRDISEAFGKIRIASVCLRDGNQALENPMTPEQKLEYFQMLVRIGFQEIEVGFPSASQDDFDFVRLLIDGDHIPDDVVITVLTQCRDDLIKKTFDSLQGVKRAVVHAYIATSDLHMRQVFKIDRDRTIAMAVNATRLIRQLADEMEGSDINFEFSPEEFTDTNIDFALQICAEVFRMWGNATPAKPMILNLPATVERLWPHQVADMFEYFCRHFDQRDSVIISAHPHNDQGMAVASAIYAVMAGADRIEGALLGHGERTGNVDLITVILDLLVMGVETNLDFSNLPKIVETVVRLTGMPVNPRHPYAGMLVFTAFSGSHQDAIKKGMDALANVPETFGVGWDVPYLLIDPADLGRIYEKLIRINSQSGKGGIAWVMRQDYGIDLPKPLQPIVARVVQTHMDKIGGEVTGEQLMQWFTDTFLEPDGPYQLDGYWINDDQEGSATRGVVKIRINGEIHKVEGEGDGPIDAFSNALDQLGINGFQVTHDFAEKSRGDTTDAEGIAFMPLTFGDDQTVWWGVGTDKKTHVAAAFGIISALNRRATAMA